MSCHCIAEGKRVRLYGKREVVLSFTRYLRNGRICLRLMAVEDGVEAAVPLTAVSRAKLEMTDALIEEHRLAQHGAGQAH